MSWDGVVFEERFVAEVADNPISFVDVGARGSLPAPWDAVDRRALQVVGFEPDPEECRRLNDAGSANDVFIPVAVWSRPTRVPVHVADFPGCSSVHPPNDDVIRRYEEEHWRPRETRRVVEFDTATLDSALDARELGCDFLKIDTQGSELEILRGSAETLDRRVYGVLVETWTVEVHRGQGLTGDVMVLMNEAGFELFDADVAAAWHRDSSLGGKRQLVGLDLLFFKRPPLREGADDPRMLKAAAIAELYGYPDLALELLGDRYPWAAESIRAAARRRARASRRLERLAGRLRRRPVRDFPPLHG
jgi:FkbM family methyltransferase